MTSLQAALWNASDVLFPSIYLQYKTGEGMPYAVELDYVNRVTSEGVRCSGLTCM